MLKQWEKFLLALSLSVAFVCGTFLMLSESYLLAVLWVALWVFSLVSFVRGQWRYESWVGDGEPEFSDEQFPDQVCYWWGCPEFVR